MKLFEPCMIGKMELKNRLVMPPMTNNLAKDGFVTDEMIRFYEERAKGGVGLITVEDGIIDAPVGNNAKNAVAIDDDKYIPALRDLTRTVKKYGAKVIIQLSHGGRRAGRVARSGYLEVTRGMIPVAPSAIPHPATGYVVPKALTIEEIQETIRNFGQATRRALEAGFDSVGLHCAHMYLCGEFLSPWANKRTDEYGRDFEGRLRFVLEVIERIRKETGPDLPIVVRMNGQEPEGGNTLKDIRRIAQRLEKAGVDTISVSVGFGAVTATKDRSFINSVTPSRMPDGCIVHLAENIKKGVSIPVIAVNKIPDAQFAERILQEGKADLVALGRPLIADPEFPKKSMEGRFDDITPCIYCCQGCVQNILEKDVSISCSVNPLAGREVDFEVTPALTRKKVLIVGGGPGGLETAIIATKRGHEVSIYEKAEELGGQLLVAAIAPGKSDVQKITRYLKNQVSKLGIKVELGKEVTQELIEMVNPDAVVVATGARPIVPPISGVERENVVMAVDVLRGEVETGKQVVIIGGGQVGVETAEYLAEKGKNVTVIEMLQELAIGMPSFTRAPLLLSLEDYQVKMLAKTTAEEITETGVVVNRGEKRAIIPADTVVLAAGFKPNRELAERLKGRVPELYTIGDCVAPRRILEAIHEGFEVALKL